MFVVARMATNKADKQLNVILEHPARCATRTANKNASKEGASKGANEAGESHRVGQVCSSQLGPSTVHVNTTS